MIWSGLHIWGDSLLKGVVFDELRNRYVILKDNCIARLKDLMPCPVENHARMGLTAAQAIDLVEAEPPEADALALIEFGGNDCDMDWAAIAADPLKEHQPNTPPQAFAEKLERLVAQVRGEGMRPMLVVPTPLCATRYFDWVTRALDREAVLRYLGDVEHIYRWQELYACTVYRTALKLACPILDLRTPFLQHRNYKELLCVDGIHPNAAGHALMLETLRTALC